MSEMGRRVAEVLRTNELPVALIESRSHSVVAISPAMAHLVGRRSDDVLGREPSTFLETGPSGALSLLLSGKITSYSLRSRVRTTLTPVVIWVRLLSEDSHRYALAFLVPERRGGAAAAAMLRTAAGEQYEQLRVTIARFTDEVLSALGQSPPRSVNRDLLRRLGEREREVVLELLRGNRVPAIAKTLFLSPGTVRNHLSSAYRKLGVSGQQELIDLMRTKK